MQTRSLSRLLRTFCVIAAVAGLMGALGTPCGNAQNAAQRNALAHLRERRLQTPPNGLEASSISLLLPVSVAFDAPGNIFIADTGDNLVLKIDLAGVVTTVAGTGDQGYGGDGGAATSAQLDTPSAIAADTNGNLYIADTHNHCIREVSGGLISTIAGTGMPGFSGDGGPATAAMLALPTALALDKSGNLYIADTDNHRIRKITGTVITTVAGDGEQTYSGDGGPATAAGLDSPSGIAVDATLNLYIGDTNNDTIRMVASSTGIISTLAGTGEAGFSGDGSAATATLAHPRGVALDAANSVYLADSENNRVRVVSGGSISTIAGNGFEGFDGDTGNPSSATLDTPHSLAIMGNTVAIADTENQRIREVVSNTINTIGGQPAPGTESLLISGPLSIVYGTSTLTATFTNGSNTGTGIVTFYDGQGAGATVLGTASLTHNAAAISTASLTAGNHSIVAAYAGDANNSAVTSGVYVLVVTPVALTAVANPVNLLYGQPIPSLSGTLNGLLTQDTGKVTPIFATTASVTSPAGTYPITVTLIGPASINYTVTLAAGSGAVQIAKAPTTTTLASSSLSPSLGQSVTLTATVVPQTSGTPSGSVGFYNGSTLLSTVSLSGGVATLNTSSLSLGAQNITASYSGDSNFNASTSQILAENILQPDFSLAASPTTETVRPGNTAIYQLTLTPGSATFANPVNLSVSGLPAGASATFAPSSVAAGAGTTKVALSVSITQSALLNGIPGSNALPAVLALLMLPMAFTRRARKCAGRLSSAGKVLGALLLLVALTTLAGCGAHRAKIYPFTVSAVSGTITHTSTMSITVQ